jgi:hypothetical protein
MAPTLSSLVCRPSRQLDASDERRILAEFTEVPGLRLTVAQAARVFHIHYPECGQILRELVRSGDLWTDGQTYRLPGY